MLVKNVTDKTINKKVGVPGFPDFAWKTIKPGEVLDVPEGSMLNPVYGLAEVSKFELSEEAKKKLADVKADLADDGKRNYSHDPKRKSPGAPKKKRINRA